METLNATKNFHFTELRSLTRAHKNRRSSVSTRQIGIKFAAIGPTKIKTAKPEKKGIFCYMVGFRVAGHIWYCLSIQR